MNEPAETTRVRVAFYAAVTAAAVVIVIASASSWFVFDDWMLLGSRRDVLRDDGVAAYLLRPHNEHLMAAIIGWHHVLVQTFGLGTYLPFAISMAVTHAAIAVMLRAIMLRLGVRSGLAAAAAVFMMLWGPAAGCMLWGMEAVFPMVLGMWLGAVLLVWHDGPTGRREVGAAVLGLLALASQSLAVPGFAILVVMLAVRRRWTAAVVVASAFLPYALWWVTVRPEGRVYVSLPGETDLRFPVPLRAQFDFFAAMLSSPFHGLGPTFVGFVVVVAAVAVGLWRARADAERLPVLGAHAAFAVAFAILTSNNRAILGTEFASSYRYVYVMTVLLLPFLVLGLQAVGDKAAQWIRPAARPAFLVVVLASLFVWSSFTFVDERRIVRTYMAVSEREVLAVATAPDLADLPGDQRVQPVAFDLKVSHVRQLVAEGLLP